MIRKIREDKGLTQKELADKIGKSEKYVKRLEENFMDVNPTIGLMRKLSEAFDMCPYILFCKICRTHLKPECKRSITECLSGKCRERM